MAAFLSDKEALTQMPLNKLIAALFKPVVPKKKGAMSDWVLCPFTRAYGRAIDLVLWHCSTVTGLNEKTLKGIPLFSVRNSTLTGIVSRGRFGGGLRSPCMISIVLQFQIRGFFPLDWVSH
jgi:hypothetical protein